jgi:glycosyltransferase involved in cell wall biosynthesis
MLFSTKILFDSFDKFAMAFIPPRLRILYKVVDLLENVLSCKVDVLITVSEERLSTFGKCKPKRHEVIMNCPDDLLVKNKNDVSAVDKNDFILVYTGIISYDRGLSLLANAIKEVKGVHLILAGRVAQDIKQLLQNPNVQYLGVLEYEEALNLQGMADAVPILYDPKIPINRVANPNKLFEAMMLGVPVITNVCEEIVKEAGCGVVVEYEYESVKRALQYLVSHPEVRERMGANGRRAFEEKYNWNLQEKRLLKIIEELFDESKKGASGERVCR